MNARGGVNKVVPRVLSQKGEGKETITRGGLIFPSPSSRGGGTSGGKHGKNRKKEVSDCR